MAEKLNFDRIFSSKTKSEDRFFAVFYAPNKMPMSRVGVSVAKRIVNKAAKRNRLKRLIKNSFSNSFSPQNGTDVVVRVKDQATKPGSDKMLSESLVSHWKKIMNCSSTQNRENG